MLGSVFLLHEKLLFALLLLCGSLQSVSYANDEALLQKEQAAFNQAVKAAADCVVQIETFGGLERVGDEVLAEGPTTGTIVAAEGWIVSSLYSFRQQPASILIKLPDGERVAARVVARDFSREIALLKVDVDRELPIATAVATNAVQVGQWGIALGKTYDPDSVSQSVGIVSALGRAYGRAVQTDAKVSPINYGGPLIDLQGRVIGILSPISPGTFFESNSAELYDSGIGFAIPLVDILQRLPTMQKGTDIHPGKLGIVSNDPNELAGPVRLTGATPGSPASKAGLQAGDVIVEAGGKPIRLLADLKHALAQVDAGDSVQLAVQRDGKQISLECQLVQEIPPYYRRYLGLRLDDSKNADSADNAQGLIIEAIDDNSPASRTNSLAVGDRIVACDAKPLRSTSDLAEQLAVAELDQALELEIVRGDANTIKLKIVPGLWPTDIPATLPDREERTGVAEVLELTLGDVPNKAFAVVPPESKQRSMGLLVVFPEPGALDQQKTLEHWEKFCKTYGWIVAVIQSGTARAWTMEEIELAGRVISRLDQTFELDAQRTVLTGWGVGGRVALAAAVMERQRVQGVMTLGTDMKGLALRTANAPLQSLDFLFVGDGKQSTAAAEALREQGYSATLLDAAIELPAKWEQVPMDKITRWLEGLGRL